MPDKPARVRIAGYVTPDWHTPRVVKAKAKAKRQPFRMACMTAAYRKVRLPLAA